MKGVRGFGVGFGGLAPGSRKRVMGRRASSGRTSGEQEIHEERDEGHTIQHSNCNLFLLVFLIFLCFFVFFVIFPSKERPRHTRPKRPFRRGEDIPASLWLPQEPPKSEYLSSFKMLMPMAPLGRHIEPQGVATDQSKNDL